MKKRIGIFLAALLLLSSCGRDSGRLKMGAAGLGGTYQAFSDAFAKLESETNNREIEVRTTAGSAANLPAFIPELYSARAVSGGFAGGCLERNRAVSGNRADPWIRGCSGRL